MSDTPTDTVVVTYTETQPAIDPNETQTVTVTEVVVPGEGA